MFGIARRGAVWCPINPRNEADENRALLELFDCECLLFHSNYADMVARIAEQLPGLRTAVCLDQEDFADWLADGVAVEQADPPDDLAMLVGTGGTTGLPKGVMLTARNLETMTALTLMGYPFSGRPAYLALAPLTHAAGVLCFPVMALGGRIVVMRAPDLARFLALIEGERITHTFLPPTLIYMLLGHENVGSTDLSSLQCFWYGAAPMSTARLEEALERDRARDGAAVRPDRGADDGLDAPARRALRRGRQGRRGAAGLRGAASAAGAGRASWIRTPGC